jgi:hypothetical protein
MSKEKNDKMYFDTLGDSKAYNSVNSSGILEPFLPASLYFGEGDSELAFEILKEILLVEEEIEIPIDLYNEIKNISNETSRSVEKVVRGALEQYITKYRKSKKDS